MKQLTLLSAAAIAATLCLTCYGDPARPAGNDVSADTRTPSESQREGRERLFAMASYLAGLDGFGVTIRGGADVVQDDGRKIQFIEVRDLALARPDRMRVDARSGNGRDSYTLFDGSRMTVLDAESNVYAQADQPGSVDDAILYFVRDLRMTLPLAPLLTTRFPEELSQRLTFVDYVETDLVFEEPTHHVVGSTGSVDFQIWIADGDEPLPQRIVMTYPDQVGQPQFWAEFSDWNIKPRFRKSAFEFEPPKGANQIVFAVQLSPMQPGIERANLVPAGGAP